MSTTQAVNEAGEPPKECAICDESPDVEVELFTMSDYVDANFGEPLPGYHLAFCWYHWEQIEERNEKLPPGETVISSE